MGSPCPFDWEKQTLLGLKMGVVSAFCRRAVWWIDCQRGCWQCVLVSSAGRNLMFPMINSASLEQAFWSCACWGLWDFLLRFFFFALWHLCANWWYKELFLKCWDGIRREILYYCSNIWIHIYMDIYESNDCLWLLILQLHLLIIPDHSDFQCWSVRSWSISYCAL